MTAIKQRRVQFCSNVYLYTTQCLSFETSSSRFYPTRVDSAIRILLLPMPLTVSSSTTRALVSTTPILSLFSRLFLSQSPSTRRQSCWHVQTVSTYSLSFSTGPYPLPVNSRHCAIATDSIAPNHTPQHVLISASLVCNSPGRSDPYTVAGPAAFLKAQHSCRALATSNPATSNSTNETRPIYSYS